MNNKYDNLIHPETKERVEASTSLTWLWVLLVGPFHHLFNGRVSTFFLYCLLFVLTVGWASLYYLFWCRTVARNYYLNKGFVPFADYEKERKDEERHKQMVEMMVSKS